MANSTRLPLAISTFIAYWLGARMSESSFSKRTSPYVPRSFTLVNAFLRDFASAARAFISPSPWPTLSSCLLTISNDWDKRVSRVFCSFSSTTFCICSNLFSLLSCKAFMLTSKVVLIFSIFSILEFWMVISLFSTCSPKRWSCLNCSARLSCNTLVTDFPISRLFSIPLFCISESWEDICFWNSPSW